jgi:acyl carrier protein
MRKGLEYLSRKPFEVSMSEPLPEKSQKLDPWTSDEVLEELKIYFNVLQGTRDDLVTYDARLQEDIGVDSIDYMALILQIGEDFDVESVWDLEKGSPDFRTVGDIARFIAEATSSRPSRS